MTGTGRGNLSVSPSPGDCFGTSYLAMTMVKGVQRDFALAVVWMCTPAILFPAKPGLRERLLKCVHDSNYASNDKPCTYGPSEYARSHNYQETEGYANNPPCQCTNRRHKRLLFLQYFELTATTRPRFILCSAWW